MREDAPFACIPSWRTELVFAEAAAPILAGWLRERAGGTDAAGVPPAGLRERWRDHEAAALTQAI
jgi:hypothetical protein